MRHGSDRAAAGPPDIPGLAARAAAARLLAAVIDAKTPLDGLTDAEHGHPQYLALEPRDRSLVRAILATTLRFRVTISKLIESRLERPLPAKATQLSHILHVGAAQILFLDVPDSAAVNLAVSHARSDPRTTRFAGLVNAVLRELARRKERALPKVLAETADAPDWLAQRLAAAYGPEKAAVILDLQRSEAPTDFTVKADLAGWAERFGGIVLPTGTVRVAKLDGAVADLDGFADGAWWVQDAAAGLPARMLGDVAGLRVADLCAAPGGKTAQLAMAGAKVTAVDVSANRLKRLQANLQRLKLDAEIVQADLLKWQPERPFDAVLIDAPCSSTGTVRRHPDVPWTKSPADIEKLAHLQRRLLERAVTFVRPGGRIVFSNCSLDPLEGEELAAAFLRETGAVESDPLQPGEIAGCDDFIDPEGRLRTTPADLPHADKTLSGLDGFFAARFRRRA
ncbi:RsmB/NOP family class I SAM-dependent RNA methyltransferase [Mesorhizobium xinjiangense]|uniref:RsmB/NOP family class I SAM-dependent RNA methyltransferase n=1 Tax=Mesorhizobium xinjiangense TaxID=2678685 RepID=UPI001F2C343E|nr:RsmB/NOP family class I SAM-dependent RNA methyltransferase [Mesorhizobium xinjiangense]